ncbi:hypothetical protein [Lactiplantibacillus plajomi]|uniref:Cell surface protein n=1 Tax=Lactiplantibacillus plajomi TaxID=1457217 RepID=A0ABV6K296_9LACO|nr:hypothetical protein [Lactiplantibacillus plajomi]
MAKDDKQSHLGKRLWRSMTEPLPDDNDDDTQAVTKNDNQPPKKDSVNKTQQPASDDEIPLVYDVKEESEHSTTSAAAKANDVIKVPHHEQAETSQAPIKVEPVSAARRSAPASAASAAPTTSEVPVPPIRVRGVESTYNDEDTPELPLSREALYGDQQPNGGVDPNKKKRAPESEQATQPTPAQPERTPRREDQNPHLKRKATEIRGHQKPSRSSWKWVLTGLAILVIAFAGALLMWSNAKRQQASAKADAERLISKIYVSDDQRDIRASVTTKQVQQLQTDIDGLKESSDKDSLQQQHDYAQKMLAVRTRYQNLRNDNGLINAKVTMDTITKGRQSLAVAGLTSSKTYFTKKYDRKFEATGKIVKKVVKYHQDFKALYTKAGKLNPETPSSQVDTVLANLKAYRKKSQLAADDYKQLTTDRKALADQNSAAASSTAAESDSSSTYSESSESSVAASSSVTATSSADSSSTTTTDSTQTSSANSAATGSAQPATQSSTPTGSTGTTDGTTNGTTAGNQTGQAADQQTGTANN